MASDFGIRGPLDRRAALNMGAHCLIPTSSSPLSKTALVNVQDFGATGTGLTDDTEAMSAAHRQGRVVYYPAGTYAFRSLTVVGGGIIGEGQGTVLQCTSGDATTAISYQAPPKSPYLPPYFKAFALFGPQTQGRPVKHSGTGLSLSASSKVTYLGAIIEDVSFRFWSICIDTTNSASFVIANCSFLFFGNFGVRLANNVDPDVGDSTIMGCHFFNGNRTFRDVGYGIQQLSSGGTRVINNKFNGGLGAYSMALNGSTSILIFNSNSVENCSSDAILLKNDANLRERPVRFSQAIISGNQFAHNSRDIVLNPIANSADSSYWDYINICNNSFLHPFDKESVSISTCRYLSITNNMFSGPGTQALKIDDQSHDGIVKNSYFQFKQAVANLALRMSVE